VAFLLWLLGMVIGSLVAGAVGYLAGSVTVALLTGVVIGGALSFLGLNYERFLR